MAASYSNQFLNARPAGATLEGYLFPDTYLIAPSTTPQHLVQSMLNNFERRVTPELVSGLSKQGLNLHQGVTLASIVEKEANKDEDRAKVAQVFLKRMRMGMKLDSDVTVQYAAGLEPDAQKETAENIRTLDSPYNSYRYAGLPPGPICSPGLSAIRAVINPARTDFLYFVADKDGSTHFAKTFAEHQANINKYLR
jgi:UPF0755 protein